MRFDDARMIGGQRFDRAAAALVLLGAVAVLVANIVAARLHPETGFFADTISNLAAGRYAWVLDGALTLFALGMAAVGVAMWRYRLDGWPWRTGAVLTVLVAASIVVIAFYEEYGDGDAGGITIHLEIVVAMALAFAAATWLVAPGLTRVGGRWSAFSMLLGLGWLLLGLAFFFLAPDDWDGLVERGAAALMVVWALTMARFVARRREVASMWAGRRVAAPAR